MSQQIFLFLKKNISLSGTGSHTSLKKNLAEDWPCPDMAHCLH